jgi:aspartate beta-hydroxylase
VNRAGRVRRFLLRLVESGRAKRVRNLVEPPIALCFYAPVLWRARTVRELRAICRSYQGWMPLCVFSEPLRWVRLAVTARRRHRRPLQRPYRFFAPHLDSVPFLERDSSAFALESRFEEIRDELLALSEASDKPSLSSSNLKLAGRWKVVDFVRAHRRFDEMIAKAPRTWAAAQALPRPAPGFGAVYVSIVEPGTRIRPHCGPTNLRERQQLVLQSDPDARVRGGHEWRGYTEGECVVLDDSFEHEVVHDGTRDRVVLIVDTWHRGLTARERELLTELHARWPL